MFILILFNSIVKQAFVLFI